MLSEDKDQSSKEREKRRGNGPKGGGLVYKKLFGAARSRMADSSLRRSSPGRALGTVKDARRPHWGTIISLRVLCLLHCLLILCDSLAVARRHSVAQQRDRMKFQAGLALSQGSLWALTTSLSTAAVPIVAAEESPSGANKESTESFFSQLDEDSDGYIRQDELQHLLTKYGGQAFDEATEVAQGVEKVLEHMDLDADRRISVGDLTAYWNKLGTILTAEHAAAWVEHGAGLPAVAERFRDHAVTGYDFPGLLTSKEEMEERGIEQKYWRPLRRAMNLKIMGVGEVPSTPQSLSFSSNSCSSIMLNWQAPEKDGGMPVHKYILQRQLQAAGSLHWESIYQGPDRTFLDTGLYHGSRYRYRLQAWNVLGHSASVILEDCRTNNDSCHEEEEKGRGVEPNKQMSHSHSERGIGSDSVAAGPWRDPKAPPGFSMGAYGQGSVAYYEDARAGPSHGAALPIMTTPFFPLAPGVVPSDVSGRVLEQPPLDHAGWNVLSVLLFSWEILSWPFRFLFGTIFAWIQAALFLFGLVRLYFRFQALQQKQKYLRASRRNSGVAIGGVGGVGAVPATAGVVPGGGTALRSSRPLSPKSFAASPYPTIVPEAEFAAVHADDGHDALDGAGGLLQSLLSSLHYIAQLRRQEEGGDSAVGRVVETPTLYQLLSEAFSRPWAETAWGAAAYLGSLGSCSVAALLGALSALARLARASPFARAPSSALSASSSSSSSSTLSSSSTSCPTSTSSSSFGACTTDSALCGAASPLPPTHPSSPCSSSLRLFRQGSTTSTASSGSHSGEDTDTRGFAGRLLSPRGGTGTALVSGSKGKGDRTGKIRRRLGRSSASSGGSAVAGGASLSLIPGPDGVSSLSGKALPALSGVVPASGAGSAPSSSASSSAAASASASASFSSSSRPYDTCQFCLRRFGWTLLKHHCSLCTSVFCSRHGHTPHPKLMDCGIPGNCVCLACLRVQQQHQQHQAMSATAVDSASVLSTTTSTATTITTSSSSTSSTTATAANTQRTNAKASNAGKDHTKKEQSGGGNRKIERNPTEADGKSSSGGNDADAGDREKLSRRILRHSKSKTKADDGDNTESAGTHARSETAKGKTKHRFRRTKSVDSRGDKHKSSSLSSHSPDRGRRSDISSNRSASNDDFAHTCEESCVGEVMDVAGDYTEKEPGVDLSRTLPSTVCPPGSTTGSVPPSSFSFNSACSSSNSSSSSFSTSTSISTSSPAFLVKKLRRGSRGGGSKELDSTCVTHTPTLGNLSDQDRGQVSNSSADRHREKPAALLSREISLCPREMPRGHVGFARSSSDSFRERHERAEVLGEPSLWPAAPSSTRSSPASSPRALSPQKSNKTSWNKFSLRFSNHSSASAKRTPVTKSARSSSREIPESEALTVSR